MDELHELKEKLCKELKKYGSKEMTAGSLDLIDKLSHTIKNLDKIIEKYENDRYSEMDGNSYRNSYARRRDSMGRYSRGGYSNNEYSREGYSMHDDMTSELKSLMNEAPDEKTRQEFKRFISKIESMAE